MMNSNLKERYIDEFDSWQEVGKFLFERHIFPKLCKQFSIYTALALYSAFKFKDFAQDNIENFYQYEEDDNEKITLYSLN